MEKDQKAIVKKLIDDIDVIRAELQGEMEKALEEVEKSIGTASKLRDDLQSKYDDMEEKDQEGKQGHLLVDLVEKADEVLNELENVKEGLETNPFEDVIENLSGMLELE
jgi:hypothetical protein